MDNTNAHSVYFTSSKCEELINSRILASPCYFQFGEGPPVGGLNSYNIFLLIVEKYSVQPTGDHLKKR